MSALGRLAAYDLVERLGAGGMAETYVAVRRGPADFEQRVCIKRVLPKFEKDASFVSQFLEEARISARLRHANIVQVLDFGVADGSHYLALELVDGMDLGKLLDVLGAKEARLSVSLVALLAHDLATALDYSHSHAAGAVFHRDVSPSNVLLSRAGEIKLSDFGIAKSVASRVSTPNTVTGVVKGKVPYLAAEYALSGRFDARSDLFSLGVLLYECLAGRRPYVGITDLDTVHQITTGRHPSLAELRPDAPAALVAAIERLLRPEPDERHPSAAALLDALGEVAPPMSARRELASCVRASALPATPVALEATPPRGEDANALEERGPSADGIDASAPTRTLPFTSARETSASVPDLGAARDAGTDSSSRRRRARVGLLAGGALALAIGLVFWRASEAPSPPAEQSAGPRPIEPARSVERDAPAAAESPRAIELQKTVAATPTSDAIAPMAQEPVSIAPRPRVRTTRTAATTRAEERSSTTQPSSEALARVRVTVAPWGLVWIDGHAHGRAPVELELASGTHRIEAGFDAPLVSRSVTLASGASERVFIDLPEPD